LIRHGVGGQGLIETVPSAAMRGSVDFKSTPAFVMAAVETSFEVFTNVDAMNSRENHDNANAVEVVS